MDNVVNSLPNSVGEKVRVRIRNVAFGGDGVGEVVEVLNSDFSFLLGKSTFVPMSVPGEVLSVKVVEDKKNYLKAEILEILEESENRVSPACSFFSQCGGCSLQHVDSSFQRDIKFGLIKSALVSARLGAASISKLKPLVSDLSFYYRRRIILHLDGLGNLGFYKKSSREVVSIDSCNIATEGINSLIKTLSSLSKEIYGQISTVHLEEDDLGVITVFHSRYDMGKQEVEKLLARVRPLISNVLVLSGSREIGSYGRTLLELEVEPGVSISVPAGGFSQVNWSINRKLVKRVVELLSIKSEDFVEDLYSGAGNFSLPFAKRAKRVIAVESDSRLNSLARDNASKSDFGGKLKVIEASVEKYVSALKPEHRVDSILADPPRAGLENIAKKLKYAKKLALISCHLPSFIKDLKVLEEIGWNLVTIEPFDMFPQTTHVEILSYFERY